MALQRDSPRESGFFANDVAVSGTTIAKKPSLRLSLIWAKVFRVDAEDPRFRRRVICGSPRIEHRRVRDVPARCPMAVGVARLPQSLAERYGAEGSSFRHPRQCRDTGGRQEPLTGVLLKQASGRIPSRGT